MQKYITLCAEALAKRGRDLNCARHYKDWFLGAGLVDVVETTLDMPCNTWPKDPVKKQLGKYMVIDADGAVISQSHKVGICDPINDGS